MPRFEGEPVKSPRFKGEPVAAPETKWREPGMIVPVQFSEDGQYRWAVPQIVTETIRAIETPGKAARGEYGIEIDEATGRPTTITNEMIGGVMGTAGLGLTPLNPAARVGAQFGRNAIPGPARRMVQRSLDADGVPSNEVGQRLAALGPDAVVADLGPNVRARAAAIATMPGSGARTVVDTLSARRAGSNARIQGDVNDILGPTPTPSGLQAEIRANQQALSPAYQEALHGASAVDTSDIALTLDSRSVTARGAVQTHARRIREMLNVPGTDELDRDPAVLLATRQAIDDMLTTATGNNEIGFLSQTRQQVDDLLAQAVPNIKDVDAQFSELARQGEAVQSGQQLLESGRTAPRPNEVEDMMTGGAVPQGTLVGPSAVPLRLREGARAEIDRIIGTNIRDINAMKRILQGEGNWNRDRLVSVFGRDRAERLLAVLEREAAFNATEEMALQGSRTQVLKAAQEDIAGKGPRPNPVRSAANLRFGDAVADTADRALGWIYSARRGSNNDNMASALMMGADNDALPALSIRGPGYLERRAPLNALRALALQPRS